MSVMDPNAWAVLSATAHEYGTTTDAMLAPWPRLPVPDAARRAAISRLSQEMIDDRPRYGIAELAGWFRVSRAAINRARATAKDYAPRQPVANMSRAR